MIESAITPEQRSEEIFADHTHEVIRHLHLLALSSALKKNKIDEAYTILDMYATERISAHEAEQKPLPQQGLKQCHICGFIGNEMQVRHHACFQPSLKLAEQKPDLENYPWDGSEYVTLPPHPYRHKVEQKPSSAEIEDWLEDNCAGSQHEYGLYETKDLLNFINNLLGNPKPDEGEG